MALVGGVFWCGVYGSGIMRLRVGTVYLELVRIIFFSDFVLL